MTFLLNYRVFQDFPGSKKLQGFPVEIPYEFFFSTTPGNSTSFVNDPGISYALSSITLWKFHILNRPSLDFFWMDFSLSLRELRKRNSIKTCNLASWLIRDNTDVIFTLTSGKEQKIVLCFTLLTLKRHSIKYQERSFGGHAKSWHWGVALEFQHFLLWHMKCWGNYLKMHFALAFPRQCFCWDWQDFL